MTRMIETFRGVAHPWLCDAFGHLNTRNYVGMFDDASFHLFSALGASPIELLREHKGWADVKAELEFKDEVPLGHLVVVRTGVVKLGRTSLAYRHEMRGADDDRLHATMQTVTVHFDLKTRKSIPLPDVLRASAERHLLED
ncbi:MAG: acyl-CoA thioesterase [Gammaproteobacteria bacterium]|nr:acyl-CoA thioesterase [Gammaproteobacteria bacterium]NIR84863.1 acyl-CoA thioesterase [Gammaproteobacteria bacterium]NIR91712.1 acyl-CoA thioesterase [Gammaproteobacteria bacterium]NIU05910.1 acyl-CoA thioesterase [Gammaproteobacteria bacterium]NIV52957.1 acyl-CoA thioesterase [Gammaproteobacteria bacterium]